MTVLFYFYQLIMLGELIKASISLYADASGFFSCRVEIEDG